MILVFDFDGTIADSKSLYVSTIQKSLSKHSFVYPKSRIIKALGPKLEITLKNIHDFDEKTLSILKRDINSSITKKAKSLKLCPYAKKELGELKKKYRIIILTNSAKKFILAFLKHNKMTKYFDKLFCGENFIDKEEALREITKKYKTKISDVVYIADKISDVKIAKKAGCRIIIVLACSWDKKRFRKEKYAVSSMKQLEAALSK